MDICSWLQHLWSIKDAALHPQCFEVVKIQQAPTYHFRAIYVCMSVGVCQLCSIRAVPCCCHAVHHSVWTHHPVRPHMVTALIVYRRMVCKAILHTQDIQLFSVVVHAGVRLDMYMHE